jgi:hypothetical protein
VEEFGSGGSCGIHSWVEDASGERRRVSWFAPQNQAGERRLKTPSCGGTGIGLGTDGGDGRRRRLGPRCGRGGDGRRAASRAVRRPRQERRLGSRRGGRNLPARAVLAVFSKPATYPGFADPPKPWTGSSSTWRHRREDFGSKKETPPSIEDMYRAAADPTGLTGLAAAAGYLSPPHLFVGVESLESFSVYSLLLPRALGQGQGLQRKGGLDYS